MTYSHNNRSGILELCRYKAVASYESTAVDPDDYRVRDGTVGRSIYVKQTTVGTIAVIYCAIF